MPLFGVYGKDQVGWRLSTLQAPPGSSPPLSRRLLHLAAPGVGSTLFVNHCPCSFFTITTRTASPVWDIVWDRLCFLACADLGEDLSYSSVAAQRVPASFLRR
jgi:hypothetical protein